VTNPAVARKNIRFVGRSDQGGRPDGTQVMLANGHAFVGHMFSDGFSVIDVRDPRAPKPVAFIANPPNTRSHHIQTNENILLAVQGANVWALAKYNEQKDYFTASLTQSFKAEASFAAGLRVYDIAQPESPREIAFLPIPGLGVHRIWWTGGRYAYVSVHMQGFRDHIMAAIDVADPARPRLAGHWWLPGMKDDEEPRAPAGKRWAAHHAIVAGNLAYGAWRDASLTVHDISDPAHAKLISRTNWSPPFAGGRTRRCLCPTAISLSWRTRRPRTIALTAWPTPGCSTCARRRIPSALRRCRRRGRPTTAAKAASSARIICTRTGPAHCSAPT
jgi:hypothetical protein